jgi:hypothetical protein
LKGSSKELVADDSNPLGQSLSPTLELKGGEEYWICWEPDTSEHGPGVSNNPKSGPQKPPNSKYPPQFTPSLLGQIGGDQGEESLLSVGPEEGESARRRHEAENALAESLKENQKESSFFDIEDSWDANTTYYHGGKS